MQTNNARFSPGWAYSAAAWLGVSFVWHVQMGVMGAYDPDSVSTGPNGGGPLWLFLAYDGLITLMSGAGAVCVLATVRPWGARAPGCLVRVPLVIGCVLLTVRGVPGLVENITEAVGLTPHGLLGTSEKRIERGSWDFWKDMLINGFFFIGAVLLVPATRRHLRRTPRRPTHAR
ncbi:hypothetical protein [Streptomyces sp. NPDC048361]|uniref:hypothetical protein n=1 Tax=Streptomyces sp. NPDC048361 TaxID=3154720 RepID=UPI003439E261